MKLGERVLTPSGPGLVVGFSHRRPGWNLWECEAVDPIVGRVLMVDLAGPFVGVLIGNRVLPIRPGDIGIAPAKAVFPGLLPIMARFLGGLERDL